MPKISPKAKAQSKKQDKPNNSGRRLGKQNIRQSTNLSRSFGRRTANSYSKKHSKNVNANAKRSGRNTANRFASSIRPRPVVAKRVNEKPRKSYRSNINITIPPTIINSNADTAKAKQAFQDINKNNDDFAKRAKKDPILYFYSAYGAIDSLNTNTKNLKALVEAGVIKLPNIGIHYDNLRNIVIRETTKAGNSVYAAKIPIISNGLGRFLGATNMPKNAGLMSTIGAYYRGVYIKGLFGTADGIYSTAVHPIKTVEGLTDIMLNPGILGKAIKDYTNEKIIHGSIEDRAEFVGQAAFEIGLAAVTSGITGASEGTKTASTASKVAEIADDVGDISKGSKVPSKISGIGDEIAGSSNIKQPSKIVYSSKAAEIGEQAGDIAGIDKKINPVKPPSKIDEPNKPPIEIAEPKNPPIELPISSNRYSKIDFTQTDFDVELIRGRLKTDPDTAFFWSGQTDSIGGMDVAKKIAKNKGGVTLESTIDDTNIVMPEWDFNTPSSVTAWEEASNVYAEQVSGEIRAVVGSELRPGNIWENIELPRLKANPNVTKVTTIDPKTGVEKIIFER